jgi:hypothetical protein
MFHEDDIVEEIATKQQGTVELVQLDGNVVTRCDVRFVKGKEHRVRHFSNVEELRLIYCPHDKPAPGIHPSEPLAN